MIKEVYQPDIRGKAFQQSRDPRVGKSSWLRNKKKAGEAGQVGKEEAGVR